MFRAYIKDSANEVKAIFDMSVIPPENGFMPEDVAKAVLDKAGVEYDD